MGPGKPKPLKIRNRRCSRWGDLIALMLLVIVFFGLAGLFIVPRRYDRIMLLIMLGGILGMVPLMLYGFFQIWDLRRPVTSRSVTARTLFDWLVLGIRRKELGPADGWTGLVAFRGLLDKEYSVHHLKLGDEVEVDNPIVSFPVRSVVRVKFAPDPKEDYIGAEAPIPMCHAAVEIDSGKKFCLIVTESDAQKLRQWAVEKGIAVLDCDGYCPRPIPAAKQDP
jgi:hypothetical protein